MKAWEIDARILGLIGLLKEKNAKVSQDEEEEEEKEDSCFSAASVIGQLLVILDKLEPKGDNK